MVNQGTSKKTYFDRIFLLTYSPVHAFMPQALGRKESFEH